MKVITYQLAYHPAHVTLCKACAKLDDHELGTLGPVSHGLHDGSCEDRNHSRRFIPANEALVRMGFGQLANPELEPFMVVWRVPDAFGTLGIPMSSGMDRHIATEATREIPLFDWALVKPTTHEPMNVSLAVFLFRDPERNTWGARFAIIT